MISDQKKLISINQLINGKALIHHAALSNNFSTFQLILNFDGVNIQMKDTQGQTAYSLTKNKQIKLLIESFTLKQTNQQRKMVQTQKMPIKQPDLTNQSSEMSFDQLEQELKQEIHAKLSLPGNTGRTRAQRMVHIPIIRNVSSSSNQSSGSENNEESKDENHNVPRHSNDQQMRDSLQFGQVMKSSRNMEQGEEGIHSPLVAPEHEQIIVSLHNDEEFRFKRPNKSGSLNLSSFKSPKSNDENSNKIAPQHFEPM